MILIDLLVLSSVANIDHEQQVEALSSLYMYIDWDVCLSHMMDRLHVSYRRLLPLLRVIVWLVLDA